MRGLNYKALTGNILVFWIRSHLLMGGGRLQEVVTRESQKMDLHKFSPRKYVANMSQICKY